MNIAVQKSIPANNQGKQGEMRLVVHPSGMFLYIKGYSVWGSLKLLTSGTNAQDARNARRTLQENIRKVIFHDESSASSTATEHGDGTIAGPMGPGKPNMRADEHRPH